MSFVITAKVSTDLLGNFLVGQEPRWFDDRAFAIAHLGSIGFNQELFVGRKQETMRTPLPSCLTCRLCTLIQLRTARLRCQEALSQTSSQTGTCCLGSFRQHHSKNWVVTALTGRPWTKRSPNPKGTPSSWKAAIRDPLKAASIWPTGGHSAATGWIAG